MTSVVEQFRSARGGRIYRIPLRVFPGMWGNAYLVLQGELAALIDVGSGFGDSDDHLVEGLSEVRAAFGESVSWETLTHVLITHGHIDHFGGLKEVAGRTRALVGIHELDRRVLLQYKERLTEMAHRLRQFLVEAGVPSDDCTQLMEMYLLGKQFFACSRVDFAFSGERQALGPLQGIHVPGHCPGQMVFRLDDVLISGDHVLGTISPHMAPERLAAYTGLGHYLESLGKVHAFSQDIAITLGGHEGTILDLGGRIRAIEQLHEARLTEILGLISEPMTLHELSGALFPQVEGYHVLLALEETAAHVEYLHQRGFALISNVHDLDGSGTLPLKYASSSKPLDPLCAGMRSSLGVPSGVPDAAV